MMNIKNSGMEKQFTTLSGQIERITYTNLENGFTIARVKVYGRRDLVTVVGNLISPTPGEILKMKGEWTQHPRFGDQFKIWQYKTTIPATVYGIKKYLGSGLIKGIGPKMADRIVNYFGKDTLEIIEKKSQHLSQVSGIGKKRIAMIQVAWEEQKEIREVMLFLQTHGVSSGYATKIFKQYGNNSIAVVQENPYRLATDIFGIGFITADEIAKKLGFAGDCQVRVEAGILYVLHQLADEGHVYYPYEPLLQKVKEILKVNREIIIKALALITFERKVIIEDLNERLENYKENNKAVFLAKYHLCETNISARLKNILKTPKAIRQVNQEKALVWVQKKLDITLAKSQTAAIKSALINKVLVITGGPGTGKTTIIHAILKIFSKINARILLAAPTGRAAKKMSETTGHTAKTIHRLLEFSFAQGGFSKNEKNPLKTDLLVIDETSMLDTILLHHLLKAVPAGATLILVGDVNQLPAVGAGNVLGDIMGSGRVPVVKLTEIFRQAQGSLIIVNAHKINNGFLPTFNTPDSNLKKQDFYFISQEAPEKVLEIILRLVGERIPAKFGFDPVEDIQVLTPMHRGIVGAGNLNMRLQELLNPGENKVILGKKGFRPNDKVMQIKNNYDKSVFNGDIGRIIRIETELKEVIICFDGKEICYDFSELDEIRLAYAVSVHKSQGSEYPVVIIPVLIQHYILLQRNLVYTAITRGRKLVVMVGTKKAMAIAVHNNKTIKRYTGLKQRLIK